MNGVTIRTTDLGNAERFVALHGHNVRFVGTWGRYLVWDGKRFVKDNDGGAKRLGIDTARILVAESLEEVATSNALYAADPENEKARASKKSADAFLKWAVASQGEQRLKAMLSLASSDAKIAITHDRLDADAFALNVENGTLDLRTGKLRAHRREDLITKLAPVVFDPKAKCPTWERFIDRVMASDAALIAYVQRIYGYALTGSTQEHVVGFQYGNGANGKTTANGVLHEMLGDYACAAPRGLLFQSKTQRHPTELTTLHGRRFVTCAEIAEGQAFDEALVKDLSGGDPITARGMNENFWTYKPTHKFFIAGNYKPTVRGNDEGIWRRLRLIPFTVTIPSEERDKELPSKLRTELSGILTWTVRGCLAWQRDGLGDPPAVLDATAEYRKESDAVGEFLSMHLTFENDARVARRTLREVYTAWCEDSGYEALGAKRFAGRLRALGVVDAAVRIGAHVADGWRGVRLATPKEREDRSAGVGCRDLVGAESSQFPNTRAREGSLLKSGPTRPYDPTDDEERESIARYS